MAVPTGIQTTGFDVVFPNISVTQILFSAICIVIISGLYWLYTIWLEHKLPRKWRRIGTLDQINIFPLKSCAPLQLNAADVVTCDILGLRSTSAHDRSLMLIDDNNQMVSGRAYPRLVLIHTKMLFATKLQISAPDMENLELDYATLVEQTHGKDVYTSIFGAKIDALLCGERYDKWFSRFVLNKDSGMRLVYYPYRKPVRAINMRMIHEPLMTCDDTGSFNNATSYMLINLASVNDLNKRLKRPAHPLQFRGSFQLKMDEAAAYAEDHWKWLKIGDETVFRVLGPCTRCIFPTTDIFTGARDPDGKPLKTLNSYRLWKHRAGPSMGIQMGLRHAGDVRTNDIIYVNDD